MRTIYRLEVNFSGSERVPSMATTTRTANNSRRIQGYTITQINTATDITDTDIGREWLAKSKAQDSYWRTILDGHIKAVRVVEIQTESNGRKHPSTDVVIEVDTAHGTVGVFPFESGEVASGFVSNSKNEAHLAGTCRKRGWLADHICFWLETFHWAAGGGNAIKRLSKNVNKKSYQSTILTAARGGVVTEKSLQAVLAVGNFQERQTRLRNTVSTIAAHWAGTTPVE
jgi:hypothetical protein